MKSSEEFPDWFKVRGYPHFDVKWNQSRAWIYANDPKIVEKHGFFPFIRYIKKSPRYRPNRNPSKPTEIKEREIYYSSHIDSYIYAVYSRKLYEGLESRLTRSIANECVIAYRQLRKSNIDFALEAFDLIKKKGKCTALAFDVTKFFDTLNHGILLQAWKDTLGVSRLDLASYKVFRSLTSFAFVDRSDVYQAFGITTSSQRYIKRLCGPDEFRTVVRQNKLIQKNVNPWGIPQGSPISAVLSNVYMFKFDELMASYARDHGDVYRRYSDDILYICKHSDAATARSIVVNTIEKLMKLNINNEKVEVIEFDCIDNSRITVTEKPLQYLGLIFDGERVLIRPSSVGNYYRKMKRRVAIAAKSASKNKEDHRIYRKKIYRLYSHLGKRNFISYGNKAIEKLKEIGMDSFPVRRQVGQHWRKLHLEIEKKQS